MKQWLIIFSFFLPLHSWGTETLKIATIDHDLVILSSEAFQVCRSKIEQQQKKYQDDLTKKEAELRILEADLQKKEGHVSLQEFSQQRHIFEQEVEKIQKLVADRRRNIDEFFHKVRSMIIEKAMEIVQQLCQERAITLVLPKSQIIYALDSLDLTDDVLKRLNQDLPASKIAIPNTFDSEVKAKEATPS